MNLFDVEHENGPLMREKARSATETEAKAYVTWLRERRGLRLFDNVELHHKGTGSGRAQSFIYWAATFGKCLKSGGRQNSEVIAPEYQEGAYSILIPGHDQIAPRVTMETLDEDGEVLTSQTLPVEPKKGGVIWDRETVRKACGPIAKPEKAKRGKVADPIAVAVAAPVAVETQEASHPTVDKPGPAIAPSAAPAVDLDAITARLDALEAALATLSTGQGATVGAQATSATKAETAPVLSTKRTAAHERAIRRAWQERKARRDADAYRMMMERSIDENGKMFDRELAKVRAELDLSRQSTQQREAERDKWEADCRANFAHAGKMNAKRRATAQRARRMIADIRARADLDKRALAITNATVARLKRDMADPMQPERASDIARLVGERDTARTALAAMAARAERAEQTVNAMADRFEGLVSRVTRAEAALRQTNAA